jgi:hypothetical protein
VCRLLEWKIDRSGCAEDARYRIGSALHAFLRWRTVTSATMSKALGGS